MIFDAARLRHLAMSYTAAWCSQEPARVAACYSPHGSLRVNDGAPAVGRDAIAEVAQGFMTAFPDTKVQMDDLCIEPGRTVYHWTLTGTNTGPAGAGRPVRISGFEIWQMGDDGLISQSEGRFDAEDFRRQLIG